MSQPKSLPEPFSGVANDLFAAGAIQFGLHELKAHRKNRTLRLSEYYFNCRSATPPSKEKPVPEALVARIATLMVGRTIDARSFDCIAAVPDGATPYADALAAVLDGVPVIRLLKRRYEDGTTCVEGIEGDVSAFRGKRALLVEDVVTSAASTMEAVTVLSRHNVRVSDVVCVVDRQQGGTQRLTEQNITLRPLLTFRDLLDHFYVGKQIDRLKYETCIAYHAESQNL